MGGIATLFAEGPLPYILGAAVGVPIFLLVVVAPILFLNGLYETYTSSAWTLTFREVRALEGPASVPAAPAAELYRFCKGPVLSRTGPRL